jgi:hypothetical protein
MWPGGVRVFACFIYEFVLIRRHSRPVPFEYKAVPRFTEAEVLLNGALSLYE